MEPDVDPIHAYMDRRRRSDWLWLAGWAALIAGIVVTVNSVFNPDEWCNAFQCVKNYNTGAIVAGVLLVVGGVVALRRARSAA